MSNIGTIKFLDKQVPTVESSRTGWNLKVTYSPGFDEDESKANSLDFTVEIVQMAVAGSEDVGDTCLLAGLRGFPASDGGGRCAEELAHRAAWDVADVDGWRGSDGPL